MGGRDERGPLIFDGDLIWKKCPLRPEERGTERPLQNRPCQQQLWRPFTVNRPSLERALVLALRDQTESLSIFCACLAGAADVCYFDFCEKEKRKKCLLR